MSDREPGPQSHVFGRVLSRDLPTAVRAEGVWIEDADGNRYLDAAGGAIVVNVGHGERSLVEAMSAQAARTPYVHGSVFTTQALEDYADDVATVLPMDDARIYPVSGGSEAVETSMKLARAYHLARGEDARSVVIGRSGSYHGNTIGALDVGGKPALRAPYAPWLGRFPHVDAAYEYRCTMPSHPTACGAAHAEALDRAIGEIGPAYVAAFIAEPVAGATLAAAVPTDDYWPAVAEVCRRHGVLVIADEVMTGFGRTGRWFGLDHWGVRPDIVVAGKGSTSGYWPFGFAAASGDVFETVRPKGFVHGFTWSHNGVGAAVAHATLKRLREGDLVEASRAQGEHLLKELASVLADVPVVGDVRGLGLMLGIELVADRASKAPFTRADGATERVVEAARQDGLLLYSSTGHVDGTDGDLVMLGPPFVISDEECALVVERTRRAVDHIA
ncbi:MAG: aminotransferase class III-fold pyridoxal phosphate-dependent enzyme [Actinomycetota bacterium]